MKKLLIALCALYFALVAPLALAATCTEGSCASGQRCAIDSRIPDGSACFPGCSLSSSGDITCLVGTDCVSVGGLAVCVSPDSPLVTGGAPINPRCEGSRTCPTDRRYECVSGECRFPLGQACEASSQCLSTLSCINAPSGGKACLIAPPSAAGAAPSSETPFTSITPQLGVEIPGLELSAAQKTGSEVVLPFLAQYINAAYRYLVTIILIVSIVMVVYGGFRYLVGASMGDIQKGKKIILDALGGMLIVLGAYMILNTINPNTLNLKVLNLEFVKEDLDFLSDADFTAATGLSVPSSVEVSALISKVAREQGIDECVLNAIAIGESGGRANAIGYDSNAARRGVYSRAAFIRSGVRYSGSTFTIPGADPQPTGRWTGSECRPDTNNLSDAQKAAIVDRSIKNDARFDPNNPPDYGLDLHYSVGLGIGQITMHPDDATCRLKHCPNGLLGREIDESGTCYSVPEILNPEIQMLGVARLVKQKQTGCRSAVSSDPYMQARCLYYRYAGSGCSARVSVCKKTKLWAACKGMTSREVADCQGYWLGQTSDYCTDLNND